MASPETMAEPRPWPMASMMARSNVGSVGGVVEAVAAHVVGRLDEPGDGDRLRLDHERREQVPLHARRQAHAAAPAVEVVEVGASGVGGDQVAREQAELLAGLGQVVGRTTAP